MARSDRRGDEDELDPVEAADEISEDEDDLDGFSDVEDPVDLDDELDSDLDDDLPEDFSDDDDDELDADELETEVTLELADEIELVEAVTDEDDEDDDDALREGEFVCRSCFMAKRESALADAKNMLCRDCV